MRILNIDADYPAMLDWLYASEFRLRRASYADQAKARFATFHGLNNYYSQNLQKLGHESADIFANNPWLHRAWAREHGRVFNDKPDLRFKLRRKIVPWFWLEPKTEWMFEALEAEIEEYRPDVVINQVIELLDSSFWKRNRKSGICLVGQHARPLTGDDDVDMYDLMVSSAPPNVEALRRRGIRAELLRLGFEPGMLAHLGAPKRDIPLSFVGSFFAVHSERTAMLESIASRTPLQCWGHPTIARSEYPNVARSYRGEAWGIEMFKILARSRITINHHGNVPPYANNMRLYEATGVGTLLITDWKENLHEMFEPGEEVVAYRSEQECVELIEYYLEHEEERAAIAAAGQRRTLENHTYRQRMEQLLEMIG